MKRYLILLIALSGCASDHYTPMDYGMSDALSSCKKESIHKYYADKPDLGMINGAAGVAGGAIGGALAGALTGAATPDSAMKLEEINPYIEKCMKKNGYIGTSS